MVSGVARNRGEIRAAERDKPVDRSWGRSPRSSVKREKTCVSVSAVVVVSRKSMHGIHVW